MRIRSEDELGATLEALTTLYRGVEALRRDYESQPNKMRLMIEGPLDEIQRIEAGLQAYVMGIHSQPAVSLWMTLSGGLARWAETPSRILASSLDSLRRSIQKIAQYDLIGKIDSRPTKALLEASDPELVLLSPGSLRVGLRWYSSGQLSLGLTEETAVAGALEATRRAVQELHSFGVHALADEEATRRRVILRAVAQLSPTARSEVDRISLSGPALGTGVTLDLSPRTYELARGATREVTSEAEMSFDGEVRELDLDNRTFRLRRVEGLGEVACRATEELEFSRVRQVLGERARVFGRGDAPSVRSPFLVADIEPLDDSEPDSA